MQLLMLAHNRGGQLATFDKGIRELAVGTRLRELVCSSCDAAWQPSNETMEKTPHDHI